MVQRFEDIVPPKTKEILTLQCLTDCQVCGKEFQTFYNYVNNGRGRWCSFECKDAAVAQEA